MKKIIAVVLVLMMTFTGIEVYAVSYNGEKYSGTADEASVENPNLSEENTGENSEESSDSDSNKVETIQEDDSEISVHSEEKDEYAAEDSGLENSWRFSEGQMITDSSNAMRARSAAYHPDATLQGIDVSEFQGNIDWEKVKSSGIDFAILRCGYGMNQTNQDDAKFLRNATECERLGIPYGVYLYSYATNTSRASSEADHVLRLLKGRSPSYPVYYDMEDNSTLPYRANFDDIAKTFCNKISNAGYAVGVYSSLNWWNNYLTASCFDNWHKWVAQWYTTCQYEGEFSLWQYTSSGSVSGISGRVDMNYQIGYPIDHGISTVGVTEGTYTISNKAAPNIVLNVKEASIANNANVEAASPNSIDSNCRFEIIRVGNKQYKLLAEHSGKALDVRSSNKNPGAEIQQYEWHDANAQIWEFVDAGDGYYYIRSKLGTYLRLDTTNGNAVTTGTFNKEDAQKWKLTASDYRPVTDGIYNIAASDDKGMALEVRNASTADGAAICINKHENDLSQQFSIKYIGKGYYKILAEHSNKGLDVQNSSQSSGAVLQQFTDKDVSAQMWKFVKSGDSYYIKSKLGTVIALPSENYVANSVVNMQTMSDSNTQKWYLQKAEMTAVEDGIYTVKSANNSTYSMTQAGENIQINKLQPLLEQKFRITHVEEGYYKIENISDGKVLDVKNGSSAVGADIQGYKWNGTDAQLWRFVDAGQGTYLIKSKVGYFMNLLNGVISENCDIRLYEYSNASSQKWLLSETKANFENISNGNVESNKNRLFGSSTVLRYAGDDRYETSRLAASALKKSLGISRFDSMIVACGTEYPDALSGSYLAAEKEAPIILVNKASENAVKKYIENNLASKGTVYLLGGTGVISKSFEKNLAVQFKVKRLAGDDRYGTNLAILEEAGNQNDDMVICSGLDFADCLSASSVGKPILLVKNELSEIQKKYLNSSSIENMYIVGGTGAVSEQISKDLGKYADVVRIAGMNRYSTSAAVAQGFFGNPGDAAVFACGTDFPDGLAGGALASPMGIPVMLAAGNNYQYAKYYANETGISKAVVLGGKTLISDSVINNIIGK